MARSAPALATASAALLFCAPAAADDALLQLIEVLRDNGTISTEAYDMLHAAAAGQAQAANKTEAPQISTTDRLEFKSRDGDFSVRLGGRVNLDAAAYADDDSDLGSGSEIRRARLFASGRMWRDWDYKLEYEFANTGSVISGITDAYIGYGGFETADITFGHFKEPFSLENLTSDKYVTFIERSLNNAFYPGRSVGLGLQAHGAMWSAAGGVFGAGFDRAGGAPGAEVDDGYAATGRLSVSPWHEAGRVLHLGVGGSYRNVDQNDALRFRERPESHVTDTRLIDTGTLAASDLTRLGVEGALVLGPFSLQAEYVRLHVGLEDGTDDDPSFDGWYVEGSWFLTGESRPYNAKSGIFSKVTPKGIVGSPGGIGAWQVGLRFSSIDLSDKSVDGGEQTDFSAGLNWYATPNIRFMADYVKVLDVSGGPSDGDEPSLITVRGALEF